jgi:hypothetical protein
VRYLTASIVIAAAAAVYGLFSHGVYSYFMIYAFMIPLLAGAVPHLVKALKGADDVSENRRDEESAALAGDMQLAIVATLTAGSLLKGALDIYGTTSRLLILYPFIAVVILAVFLAQRLKRKS